MSVIARVWGFAYELFTCSARKVAHFLICLRTREDPPYGDKLSDEDERKIRIEGKFPNLKRWRVTGESTDEYNAWAWSLGVTDENPEPNDGSIASVSHFYSGTDWSSTTNGGREFKKRKLVLYGQHGHDVRHVSREVSDCGWHESKLGAEERIIHMPEELEGGDYESIISLTYYEKEDSRANLDLCF